MSELIKRWLTIKQAAEYTCTDEDWILAHIKSGALKYIPTARRTSDSPKGPRRRILDRIKVDALMESLEQRDTPQPATEGDPTPSPATPRPKAPKGMSSRERFDRGLI